MPTDLAGLFGIEGLRVAVTGAGAGMGAETARLAAALGARVALLDIDPNRAQGVVDDIGLTGGTSFAVRLDLVDEKSCTAAFAEAAEGLGGLDAVVHAAGIYPRVSLFDLDSEKWDQIHQVNARGTAFVIKEAARLFIKGRHGGVIVNISSVSATKVTVEDHHAYAASKAAMNSLTRSTAYELGRYDIRVNAIMPGMILSETASKSVNSAVSPPNGPMLKPGRIILGKAGAPIDVAGVAIFLMSPAASYITGQCFAVDGGFDIS